MRTVAGKVSKGRWQGGRCPTAHWKQAACAAWCHGAVKLGGPIVDTALVGESECL